MQEELNAVRKVAEDFSNAAASYDQFAELQRQVVDELLPWMQGEKRVLDAGAGTGYALQTGWTALDVAQGMCAQITKYPTICADMQALPLAASSFDAVFSSLALQWLEQPIEFFRQSHDVTDADGMIYLATLGEGTLRELREAFEQVGMFAPVLSFQSLELIEQDLAKTGWKVQRSEQKVMHTKNETILALLQNLKGLGARYKGEQSGFKGKGWLHKLEENYPKNSLGETIASWDVLMVQAQKAEVL